MILATQQIVQKLQVPVVTKYDETTQTSSMTTVTVATSTIAINTSTVSTMTIAVPVQPTPTNVQVSKQLSTTTVTKLEKINTVPNSFDDVTDASIKIGLPYPNGLKVEKFSEKSVIVTWDAPSAPISLSQSIDGENLSGTFDMSEMNILQSYNVYLNHELYTVVNVAEDRVVIVDDVDLSIVCFNLIIIFN